MTFTTPSHAANSNNPPHPRAEEPPGGHTQSGTDRRPTFSFGTALTPGSRRRTALSVLLTQLFEPHRSTHGYPRMIQQVPIDSRRRASDAI